MTQIVFFTGSLHKTLGSGESPGALLVSTQAQELGVLFCFIGRSVLDWGRDSIRLYLQISL